MLRLLRGKTHLKIVIVVTDSVFRFALRKFLACFKRPHPYSLETESHIKVYKRSNFLVAADLQVLNDDSKANYPLYGERAIAEAKLICFDNPKQQRPYEISIELPEFTCLCPFSGYPDFAILRLIYEPHLKVLELKAIKLYINSYRDRKISHEHAANQILDDLIKACNPKWMELEADFNPRGNVHTKIKVIHGKRQSF